MSIATQDRPHGSFGLKTASAYSLLKVTGIWNQACPRVLGVLLNGYLSAKNHRRCLICDSRNWGFQTPEAEEATKDITTRISEYYPEMFVAFIVSEDHAAFTTHVVRNITKDVRPSFHWNSFSCLGLAVDWLRREGFPLPDLTDNDMPESLPAQTHLDNLSIQNKSS